MYTNWNDKTLPIYNLHWYAVETMINHLRKLRYLIMNEKTLDTSKIPTLEGNSVPAKENNRFPAGKSYLCEGIGPWIQKLDIINLAIYAMMRPERLDRVYSDYKTVGEAEVFVLNGIHQFLRDLTNESTTIITRDIFEKKYDLIWSPNTSFMDNNNIKLHSTTTNSNNNKENGEGLEKND